MSSIRYWLTNMRFSQRVVTLRKQHGLTQQGLSDTAGIHVQQIKRYESGSSLPMVDALKKLAITLNVTLDFLLFEQGEPEDDMKLRFEALAAMSTADQEVAKVVIDAMIVKSQVTQTVARANQKTGDVDKKDE